MEYIGEHLLPGQIGRFLLVLGFVAGIVASLSYFFATQRRETTEFSGLRKLGRSAFVVHGLSYLAVIGILFYIMVNQYYEYQYVQRHVSDELPMKYIFSAFWEGQEGSFLLWMFWHIILGFVLIRTAKMWESPVMSMLSLVQVFIGSMILGLYIYIGEDPIKIGSNPLLLLRDTMEIPLFNNKEYVSLLQGTGMNPLLQNYWMTIHPPTLFLGFASTIVPFCYAIAGLWLGKHKEWLKPVMPWALFSGMILGTGILMGGAWAYEALSFGGYWAWDPVENASLVPWLIMLAGIHTNLVAKSTGYSIKSTYLFYLLSFLLIVYSTFLTRSGILGETSVHAFTEMGLEWQLVGFMATLFLIGMVLFIARVGKIPAPEKEEAASSKEFWIFIGSLVFLFSSFLITVSTSLPVFNKIVGAFDPTHVDWVINDQEAHHNKYQLWIGVLIGLFSGIAQYLRFKEFNFANYRKKFLTHTGIAIVLSAILTFLTTLWIQVAAWQYLLLLFSGIFAVVTNLDYLFTFIKGNFKLAGSAVSHIGFGIMMVGIIASGTNKHHISKNTFAMDGVFADKERIQKNLLLIKGKPMFMSGYMVNYERDTVIGNIREYLINCQRLDENGQPTAEQFQLRPNVIYDHKFNFAAANPYTKRYFSEDIFSSVADIPPHHQGPDEAKAYEDSLKFEPYKSFIGDTIFTKKHYLIVQGIDHDPSHPEYHPEPGDIAIGVKTAVRVLNFDSTWYAEPVMVLRGDLIYSFPAQINDISVKVRLPQEIFASVFTPDSDLTYQTVKVKEGDQFKFKGYNLAFTAINRQPNNPGYFREDKDIAVSALISATNAAGQVKQAEPVYFIRQNRPLNVKDEIRDWNLHIRFTEIDPTTGTMTLQIAQGEVIDKPLPIEIAENSLRMDYIVLEAIVFPGINLFWLGSVMMMFGLGMGFYRRRYLD